MRRGVLSFAAAVLVLLALSAAPAAADSIEATTYSYDGELYFDDSLEYTVDVDASGDDEPPVAVFIGADGGVVYDEDGMTEDDGDYSGSSLLSELSTGEVEALYIHPNDAEGEFGDGQFEFEGSPVGDEANRESLGWLLEDMEDAGWSQSDIRSEVISQTTSSGDDVRDSDTFDLSSESSTEIRDLGVDDPSGIEDVSPGDTVVVRGTTNRNPNEAEIEVLAVEGEEHDLIDTESTSDWSRDGEWMVEKELPNYIEGGVYTVEATDGPGLDEVDFVIQQEGEIQSCGFEVRTSGTFEIQDDLSAEETCIEVWEANDVVIEGGGHEIEGDNPSALDRGILVFESHNVTVRNVTVTGWTSVGVSYENSGGVVEDVEFSDNDVALDFTDGFATPEVRDSRFTGNEVDVDSDGEFYTAEEVELADSGLYGTVVSYEAEHVDVFAADDPPENEEAESIDHYVEVESYDDDAVLDLAFHYTSDDVDDVDEDSLGIWKHDGGSWSEVSGDSVDTDLQEVDAYITDFSTYGVFGEEAEEEDADDADDDGDDADDDADDSDDADDADDDGDDADDDADDSDDADDADDDADDTDDADTADDDADEDADDADDADDEPAELPGFGAVAALLALSLYAVVRGRR